MRIAILYLIIFLGIWVPAGQTAETSYCEDYESIADYDVLQILTGQTAETSAVLSPPQSEDVFSNALENIPSKEVETKYACLYASKGVEIPASLISNFDRIFAEVANFFRVEVDSYKVLVCVVDYETLQQMYNSNRETPIVVAAFYDPHLDSIFFTPRYMDEYYIAHELIHYFMDRYNENVAISIGKLISQKDKLALSLSE